MTNAVSFTLFNHTQSVAISLFKCSVSCNLFGPFPPLSPPWLLPSKAIFKRCIPVFGTISVGGGDGDRASSSSNETVTDDTVVIAASSNPDDKDVSASALQKSISALGELVDVQDLVRRGKVIQI